MPNIQYLLWGHWYVRCVFITHDPGPRYLEGGSKMVNSVNRVIMVHGSGRLWSRKLMGLCSHSTYDQYEDTFHSGMTLSVSGECTNGWLSTNNQWSVHSLTIPTYLITTKRVGHSFLPSFCLFSLLPREMMMIYEEDQYYVIMDPHPVASRHDTEVFFISEQHQQQQCGGAPSSLSFR